MTFDQQKLENLIKNQSYSPLNLKLHIFESLTSTNQTLWELLAQGAEAGTIVIASQQTAGRGQWGRQWQSTQGGLYLSLALFPDIPATDVAQLTLCSVWGIVTELRNYGIPVLIKWLNDLILENRKLGGILTETKIQQGIIKKAVIGIGINYANAVPDTGINLDDWQSRQLLLSSSTPINVNSTQAWEEPIKIYPLQHSPCTIPNLETLAAITIKGVLCGYHEFVEKGIETLLPGYIKLLNSVGNSVVIDGYPGVVEGITNTGYLKIKLHLGADSSEINLPPGRISLGYVN